jgi:hypothetical protein
MGAAEAAVPAAGVGAAEAAVPAAGEEAGEGLGTPAGEEAGDEAEPAAGEEAGEEAEPAAGEEAADEAEPAAGEEAAAEEGAPSGPGYTVDMLREAVLSVLRVNLTARKAAEIMLHGGDQSLDAKVQLVEAELDVNDVGHDDVTIVAEVTKVKGTALLAMEKLSTMSQEEMRGIVETALRGDRPSPIPVAALESVVTPGEWLNDWPLDYLSAALPVCYDGVGTLSTLGITVLVSTVKYLVLPKDLQEAGDVVGLVIKRWPWMTGTSPLSMEVRPPIVCTHAPHCLYPRPATLPPQPLFGCLQVNVNLQPLIENDIKVVHAALTGVQFNVLGALLLASWKANKVPKDVIDSFEKQCLNGEGCNWYIGVASEHSILPNNNDIESHVRAVKTTHIQHLRRSISECVHHLLPKMYVTIWNAVKGYDIVRRRDSAAEGRMADTVVHARGLWRNGERPLEVGGHFFVRSAYGMSTAFELTVETATAWSSAYDDGVIDPMTLSQSLMSLRRLTAVSALIAPHCLDPRPPLSRPTPPIV